MKPGCDPQCGNLPARPALAAPAATYQGDRPVCSLQSTACTTLPAAFCSPARWSTPPLPSPQASPRVWAPAGRAAAGRASLLHATNSLAQSCSPWLGSKPCIQTRPGCTKCAVRESCPGPSYLCVIQVGGEHRFCRLADDLRSRWAAPQAGAEQLSCAVQWLRAKCAAHEQAQAGWRAWKPPNPTTRRHTHTALASHTRHAGAAIPPPHLHHCGVARGDVQRPSSQGEAVRLVAGARAGQLSRAALIF